MKILYSWLKDFVDIDLTPAELGDKLVGVGFEIEEIIYLRDNIKNVFACKVTEMKKHPDSDHMWVCDVTDGKNNYQIVTGAQNVKIGDIVPVALDNAVLPDGKVIKKGKLRGVESEGMMCSGEELGLSEEDYVGASVYGILILKNDTSIGADINDVLGNDDAVLDIAVTANRPDCNSVLGIAREVAAVCGKKLKMPDLSYKTTDAKVGDFIKAENRNFELCPRYMAAAVYDVVEKESPKIIRDRLKAVGIRPINNLVDVTNYILTEIGQPMHAFDLNNLSGGKIIVRNAAENEKITALDGKEYSLKSHQLAICDEEKPVAIAGIMGGEYSSICDTTQTVILESARFARDSIRHTSREINLHSDSSARYEKGIDYYSQEMGLKRALSLFYKYGWGKIASGTIDLRREIPEPSVFSYDYRAVNRIIGIDIDVKTIVSILNSLELKTTRKGYTLTTVVPEYREDIVGINDIAEEVVRYYGYDELKPRLIFTKNGGKTEAQEHMDKLKALMVGYGAQEIVTYSFVSPKSFDMLRLDKDDVLRNAIEIKNPLGADFSVMRTTLSSALLKVVSANYTRGNKKGRLFEVANVYLPKALPLNELPLEREHLGLAFYGDGEDFYQIKSVIEDISETFSLDFEFKRDALNYMHPGRTAFIYSKGQYIGYVGEVHPEVRADYGIDKRVYIAEIDARFVAENGVGIKPYKAISRFQSVERDIALIAPIETEASTILAKIGEVSSIVENMEIFDVYVGGQVPSGKKSVAVKLTMRMSDRTLTDGDVNDEISKILKNLEKSDVTLR